jgi:selenocysteine lyase/cysteine desulfurase
MDLAPLPQGFDPSAEFPSSRKWNFFQHAGVSPLSRRAAGAVKDYADLSMMDAYVTGKFYKRADLIRANAAKLINAQPEELAFVKNTSEGLSFVANGLTWKAGEEILSTGVEYPANVYPWMDLERRFGVKHVMVAEREGRIVLEDLLRAVTGKTRMIAISHVEFASGYRNDLVTIGKFCRERGILFCVDAIQGCGALPVDVKGMSIDYLSCGGHKWILGPEGLGFFFCRKELIEGLHPEVGSMNVVNATDYQHYDLTLRKDAKRFECGGYNIAGIMGFGAAVELLLEIGVETIWKRVHGITTMIAEGVKEKGYTVVSPRDREEECSGILTFVAPDRAGGAAKHAEILGALAEKNIIMVERNGRLRAAPHFYQGEEHVRALVEALP